MHVDLSVLNINFKSITLQPNKIGVYLRFLKDLNKKKNFIINEKTFSLSFFSVLSRHGVLKVVMVNQVVLITYLKGLVSSF